MSAIPLRSAIHSAWLSFASITIANAAIFDDGLVHDIDSFIGGNTFVRDSTGGIPTTVNVLNGGGFTALNVEDFSVASFFAGSTIVDDIDALDNSTVTTTVPLNY